MMDSQVAAGLASLMLITNPSRSAYPMNPGAPRHGPFPFSSMPPANASQGVSTLNPASPAGEVHWPAANRSGRTAIVHCDGQARKKTTDSAVDDSSTTSNSEKRLSGKRKRNVGENTKFMVNEEITAGMETLATMMRELEHLQLEAEEKSTAQMAVNCDKLWEVLKILAQAVALAASRNIGK
ncbi:hypothetical protein R1flu_020772 [Riccia fluitans]|uniref:Uncharacterized protein n=1 Tax=Riccia fluitans TaxID=41844 RepID=A0ABD1ZQW6_9MARC